MPMQCTFTKEERLKSKKDIAQLFKSGGSLLAYPVLCRYSFLAAADVTHPAKVAFVVPKKRQKLAVNRNRVKRQIREAYRLNKAALVKKPNGQWHCLFIYVGKEPLSFANSQKAMLKIFDKLNM